MKLVTKDKRKGYVKLEIENDDDLWFLKDFVQEGDTVRKFTQRTKSDGREKKSLKLTIEVEKLEYEKGRLRLTGEMTETYDDVEKGYHTFNISSGDELELTRDNFTNRDWEALEEAERKKSYEILFCLVEKDKADLFIVRESGIENLSQVESGISGKMYEKSGGKSKEEFFKELSSILERNAEKVDSVVLAGPGFEKENLKDYLSDNLDTKVFVQDTSVTGRTGLHEAFKRGVLDDIVESSRIDEETSVVEEFLDEVKTDGKAVFGSEVEDMVEMGAVEKLIVTKDFYRENTSLAEDVENMGGEVVVVNTDHEAGQKLANFGGVAALLRYKP